MWRRLREHVVRSAPYIFTRTADLVVWIAKQNYGVKFLMHNLDDLHTLGPPGAKVRQSNLDRSIGYLSILDIPPHLNNLEGTSTCLIIRGIMLDHHKHSKPAHVIGIFVSKVVFKAAT